MDEAQMADSGAPLAAVFNKETDEEKAFRKDMEACQSVLSTALGAHLPTGTDFHYFKTFEEFSHPLAEASERLKTLLQTFPGAEVAERFDLGDPEEAIHWMVEVMDTVLERVDRAVDEGNERVQEVQKATFQASQGEGALPKKARQVAGSQVSERERRQQEWILAQSAAGDSVRPQRDFEDLIDNSNEIFPGVLGHWREYIEAGSAAPGPLVPLLGKLQLEAPTGRPPQPLKQIVDDLAYPDWLLQPCPPQLYRGLSDAPVTLVETPEQLLEMAAQLSQARELAVDLEHHSFRTFQGITCLMQISDRNADFLVDVIKLRRSIGPVLAPLFANPEVVKVLHGCDWDVQWLQRDFGIYIANLFDTGQAARVLQLERYGLAHLLQRYCNVKADKRYQLADWRIRPISPEMQLYARMDTHYLLYMYDCLRMELHSAGDDVPPHLRVQIPAGKPGGALGVVLERSRQLSLTLYNKPLFHDNSYLEVLENSRDPIPLTRKSRLVFAALFKWRDSEARSRDESYDYVLPKRQMTIIAKALPTTAKELKTALLGNKSPSMVEALADSIVDIVSATLKESSPHTETAATDAKVEPSKPAPAVSFWKGPELHAGLRPAAEALQLSTSSQTPEASSTATETGTPNNVSDGRDASTTARALRPESASELPIGVSVAGESAPTSGLELRKLQVKPLQRRSKPGAFQAALSANGAPTKKKASAFAAAFAKSAPLQPSPAAETAKNIRDTFSMPFPSVPEPAAPSALEEAPDAADNPRLASGEEIRAIADELRGEPAGTSQSNDRNRSNALYDLGDYLPISEQRRRSHLANRKRTPQDVPDEKKAKHRRSEPDASPRAGDEVDAIIRAAGLTSSSDSGAEPLGTPVQRRNALQESPGPVSAEQPGAASEGRRLPERAGEKPLGSHPPAEAGAEGGASDSFTPYDYSAARAAAPGLDVALRSENPRGRGDRGRRGRGARGRARGEDVAADPFNAYQLDESKFLKGGKRTAVMPRSGNKSNTFR